MFTELHDGTRSGLSQEALPAFTKLLGAGSIYAISPCTEETAKAWTARQRQRSFGIYEAPRLAAPATVTAEPEEKYCVDCGCELVASPHKELGLCADCLADVECDDELA